MPSFRVLKRVAPARQLRRFSWSSRQRCSSSALSRESAIFNPSPRRNTRLLADGNKTSGAIRSSWAAPQATQRARAAVADPWAWVGWGGCAVRAGFSHRSRRSGAAPAARGRRDLDEAGHLFCAVRSQALAQRVGGVRAGRAGGGAGWGVLFAKGCWRGRVRPGTGKPGGSRPFEARSALAGPG